MREVSNRLMAFHCDLCTIGIIVVALGGPKKKGGSLIEYPPLFPLYIPV